MSQDPIVAETRALREELMNEVGNDLDALFQYLQQREALHPERLVSFPPRKPVEIGSLNERPASEKGV
jgi:hypothetical protein